MQGTELYSLRRFAIASGNTATRLPMNASPRRCSVGESPRLRRRAATGAKHRRGAAAVEAVFLMPIILTLMLGVWEVGRMIQVSQILANAAREGARVAAGGYVNGTAVTVSTVQTEVQNYLTAAGLPSAAATGASNKLDLPREPGLDRSLSGPAARSIHGDRDDPFRRTVQQPSLEFAQQDHQRQSAFDDCLLGIG